MNNRGRFMVTRAVFDHHALRGDPFDRRSAWLWLIAEAAWDDRVVHVEHRAIHLLRGQLAHSLRFIADAWEWEHKRVNRFLERLEAENMIRRSTERGVTVVTIVNYDEHQMAERAGQPRDRDGTESGTESGTCIGTDDDCRNVNGAETSAIDRAFCGTENGTPGDTPPGEGLAEKRDKAYKQINKLKNIRSPKLALVDEWPPNAFETWYGLYPKKKARKRAERAFKKVEASEEIGFKELLERTKRFAQSASDPKFIPYPATWLNDGSYLDSDDVALQKQGAAAIAEPVRDPNSFTTGEWLQLLNGYFAKSQWSRHWGPEPGSPGCLAPSPLVEQIRSKHQHVA
jgi:hypothetical protein